MGSLFYIHIYLNNVLMDWIYYPVIWVIYKPKIVQKYRWYYRVIWRNFGRKKDKPRILKMKFVISRVFCGIQFISYCTKYPNTKVLLK